MQVNTIHDVFVDQLADLYSAEQQLVQALPKVAQAANDQKLREAFQMHLDQTRGHVERLDRVFQSMGISVPQEHCEGMEGLLKEGDQVVQASGSGPAKDAALIAAAQRVEHYEIAAYGTAKTLADQLDLPDASDLLDQTLDEESAADKMLSKIATGGMLGTGVNQEADSSR
jgi:ferritin-like metal-binding protein YciE